MHDKRLFGWTFTLIQVVLVIVTIVLGYQIVVHESHERPVVLCYPIAKASRVVGVKIPKLLFFKDSQMVVNNALWIERQFHNCTRHTAKYIPFFSESKL